MHPDDQPRPATEAPERKPKRNWLTRLKARLGAGAGGSKHSRQRKPARLTSSMRKRTRKETNRRRTQKWRLKSKATSGKRRSL